jgi:hypothetical protein
MEGDEKRFNEEIKTRVKTVKYLLSGVIKWQARSIFFFREEAYFHTCKLRLRSVRTTFFLLRKCR